jgi:hypothetical protein
MPDTGGFSNLENSAVNPTSRPVKKMMISQTGLQAALGLASFKLNGKSVTKEEMEKESAGPDVGEEKNERSPAAPLIVLFTVLVLVGGIGGLCIGSAKVSQICATACAGLASLALIIQWAIGFPIIDVVYHQKLGGMGAAPFLEGMFKTSYGIGLILALVLSILAVILGGINLVMLSMKDLIKMAKTHNSP